MLAKKQIEGLRKIYKIPSDDEKYYIIVLASDSTMPTKKELSMLLSYREYAVRHFYRNAERILAMDLPADSGHNTVTFLKGPAWQTNGKSGWCYRRLTWTSGPFYCPSSGVSKPIPPPWTLLQVLDHINTIGDKPYEKWETWKKEHPKIFS